MPTDAIPLPEKSPLPRTDALHGPEGNELRDAELATRATVPEDDDRPTDPMVTREPKSQSEEGFQEPELMKDESEDRE